VEASLNPTFLLDEQTDQAFEEHFDSLSTFNVTFSLKSVENPDFISDFRVDLSDLAYLGDDLAKILPYDAPLIIFKIP